MDDEHQKVNNGPCKLELSHFPFSPISTHIKFFSNIEFVSYIPNLKFIMASKFINRRLKKLKAKNNGETTRNKNETVGKRH